MGFSASFCITHVKKGVPCQDREHSTSVCMFSNPGADVLSREAASPAIGSSHKICSLWLKKRPFNDFELSKFFVKPFISRFRNTSRLFLPCLCLPSGFWLGAVVSAVEDPLSEEHGGTLDSTFRAEILPACLGGVF